MPNSQFSAILACKCPACRTGNMFVNQSFAPSKFVAMHKNCPHCGYKFEREPSFFTGAMYVSYAFSVAIMIAVFVATNILGIDSLFVSIGSVVGIVILFIPMSYRYSRVLYLHMFGDYVYRPQ